MKSFQRGLVRLDPGPGCYKLDCLSRVLRVYYIENAPVARGENGSDLLHDALPLFSSAYLARFARRVIHRASDRFPTSAIYALRSNDTRKPVINEYGFHWGIWFVLFPRRVTRFRGVPSPGITALFGPSQRAETRRSTFKIGHCADKDL